MNANNQLILRSSELLNPGIPAAIRSVEVDLSLLFTGWLHSTLPHYSSLIPRAEGVMNLSQLHPLFFPTVFLFVVTFFQFYKALFT